MNLWKNKLFSGVLIGLIITLIAVLLIYIDPLAPIHLSLSNLFYTANRPHPDITIVAIDEKSLDPGTGLGRYNDWPRAYFAQALTNISKYKPAVIGVDIDFSSPSTGLSQQRITEIVRALEQGAKLDFYPVFKDIERGVNHPDDIALQQVIAEAGNVVLLNARAVLKDEDGIAKVINLDGDSDVNDFGFALPDRDDVTRKAIVVAHDTQGNIVKGFDAQIAERFAATDDVVGNSAITARRSLGEGGLLINYQAMPGSYRAISFADVMADKEFDPADIENKIVLIGATAKILQDLVTAPNSNVPMPGVEVHANIIQQLLEGKFLQEQSNINELFVAALLAVGVTLVFNYIPVIISIIAFFIIGAAYWGAAVIMFRRGVLLNTVYPYATLILALVGSVTYRYITELRAKRQLKKAFAHYVNESVVEEISKHPEMLKLGGQKRTISVLFSDIVSFTSLAEKMDPEAVVSLLNEYLDVMSKVIFQHGGTLDKYEGDAIMAFFGAPLTNPQFTQMACRSALDMHKVIPSLHEKWGRESKPLIDFKVGIATGEVVVGNLGSTDRFDYTVVGDTVNLGARLESANRQYGTKILVDEHTKNSDTGSEFIFRRLDRVRVKGKSKSVQIYELVAEFGGLKPEGQQLLMEFENGLVFYEKGQFAMALKYFDAALKLYEADIPAQIFKNRCSQFLKKAPAEKWDGVVDLGTK